MEVRQLLFQTLKSIFTLGAIYANLSSLFLEWSIYEYLCIFIFNIFNKNNLDSWRCTILCSVGWLYHTVERKLCWVSVYRNVFLSHPQLHGSKQPRALIATYRRKLHYAYRWETAFHPNENILLPLLCSARANEISVHCLDVGRAVEVFRLTTAYFRQIDAQFGILEGPKK